MKLRVKITRHEKTIPLTTQVENKHPNAPEDPIPTPICPAGNVGRGSARRAATYHLIVWLQGVGSSQ